MVLRVRGGGVCRSSAAGGIGGMGGGAQGRVEWIVLHVDAADVCAVCGAVQGPEFNSARAGVQGLLWSGPVVFRAGADEQADAGDGTVCVVVAGLVAAGTIYDSR